MYRQPYVTDQRYASCRNGGSCVLHVRILTREKRCIEADATAAAKRKSRKKPTTRHVLAELPRGALQDHRRAVEGDSRYVSRNEFIASHVRLVHSSRKACSVAMKLRSGTEYCHSAGCALGFAGR